MTFKTILIKLCKNIIFLLAFLFLANPSFSMQSSPADLYEWRIWGAAGYVVKWGADKNDWYIATIDNRDPGKSRLITSPNISVANKGKFEASYAELQKEALGANLKEQETFLEKIHSFKTIHLPVKNDDALLDSMAKAPGLIWTGSGISLASGIPTLPSFYRSLGLVGNHYTHEVEEQSLRALDVGANQKLLIDFLIQVHAPAKLEIKPSPAHIAIKGLLDETKSQYITSNLDHLEDPLGYGETVTFDPESKILKILVSDDKGPCFEMVKHGDEESRLERKTLSEPFIPNWLLMVGLRIDDYGIAAWAEANKIPIYYVGPNPPELLNLHEAQDNLSLLSALSVQWIKADAQTYLPALLERLQLKIA